MRDTEQRAQYLAAIDFLDTLIRRMGEHQHKTARLRALQSW